MCGLHLLFQCCARSAPMTGPKQHTGQRPEGRFVVGGDEYAAAMRDLPTIVETYKTYDDVNMVKCADVGQVRTRHAQRSLQCSQARHHYDSRGLPIRRVVPSNHTCVVLVHSCTGCGSTSWPSAFSRLQRTDVETEPLYSLHSRGAESSAVNSCVLVCCSKY